MKTISNLPLNNKIGTKFDSSYSLYDDLKDDKSILWHNAPVFIL